MDLTAELNGGNWPTKVGIFAAMSPGLRSTPSPSTAEPKMVHFACTNPAHSAVAAVGMLLQHHRIGWNHIPKTHSGTPDNDVFMATVAGWLRHPSQCSAQHLIQSLNRAGLQTQGFSQGSTDSLMRLLQNELSQQKPVLTLTQGDPSQGEPHTVWRVLYHMNPNDSSIHTHNPFNAEPRLVWNTEEWLHKLTGQAPNTASQTLNYTVLTACKPSQPRLFVAHNALY